MTVLTASLLFFLAAAVGGAFLARAHATQTRPPRALSVGHPLLAGSGLILLGGSYVRSDGPTSLALALVILVLAACGGISLAMLRVRRGSVPLPLIAVHALIALTGTGVLVYELAAGREGIPPPVGDELAPDDDPASIGTSPALDGGDG